MRGVSERGSTGLLGAPPESESAFFLPSVRWSVRVSASSRPGITLMREDSPAPSTRGFTITYT